MFWFIQLLLTLRASCSQDPVFQVYFWCPLLCLRDWYCIKPCMYSFLVFNCGPTSCSKCICLPCLGASHTFSLDPRVVSAMDVTVYFENTDFPEWYPLPITEPQWKVLSWLQFLILSTWSKFQSLSSWDFVLPKASGQRRIDLRKRVIEVRELVALFSRCHGT